MERKSVNFRWITDQSDTGMTGYVMTHMPHFDPVRGFGLAHDLLEHFTPRAGNAGEAEAFGAMAWIRVDGGYVDALADRNRSSPFDRKEFARTLGSELGDFLEFSEYHVTEPLDCELASPPEEEEAAELLLDIAVQTAKYCRRQYSVDPSNRKAFRRIYQWMLLGYRDVQTHYDTNPQAIAEMFYDVEHTIDYFISETDPQDGDEIEVFVNPDYTWGYNVVTGRDLLGDYYQDGQRVGSEEDEDEE